MSQAVSEVAAIEAIRATLAYNQIQDRISLTCALKNEDCVVLWLTARLATQLVPHLCQAVTQVPDALPTNGDPAVTDNHAPTSAAAPDRRLSRVGHPERTNSNFPAVRLEPVQRRRTTATCHATHH